jgi:hypothetical protein
VSEYTKTSVTFSLHDPDGYQGFPGAVVCAIWRLYQH